MDRPIARTVEDPLGFSQTKRLAEEVRPKTILIVDDDADTITLVERIGRKAGYRVFGAASGEECLSLLPRVKPQLIMLDVNMADLDGFETCCRVRSDPHGAHVPIAFLTARKTVNDVKRGVAAGADDFVVKPFDAAQLVERIEFMTSCSHLLNEHRRRRSSKFDAPGAWLPIRIFDLRPASPLAAHRLRGAA
jgi:DNA-binding response OmpR family regulator